MVYVLIAVGSGLGALLRYFAGQFCTVLWGGSFPLATMLVNILGSSLMGFLAVRLPDSVWWGRPFLMVGLLGGFTTFSSFSLEAVQLLQRGAVGQLVLYVGSSVVLSLLGLAAGMMLAGTVIAR